MRLRAETHTPLSLDQKIVLGGAVILIAVAPTYGVYIKDYPHKTNAITGSNETPAVLNSSACGIGGKEFSTPNSRIKLAAHAGKITAQCVQDPHRHN